MKLRYSVKYLDKEDKEHLIESFKGEEAPELARQKAEECRLDTSKRIFIKVELDENL